MSRTPLQLTEEQVQEGFHAFLKGALAQAHAERLIDDETLASAEADLMVEGPALCLFFAALKSRTHPPSVILPASVSNPNGGPLILDITTNPDSFRNMFRLWSSTVKPIQSLSSDYQHDLARLICDKEPLSSPVREQLPRLAAELKSVAIEISQRRTFQERYSSDLQAVLDVSDTSRRRPEKLQATFVPPPSYDEIPEKEMPRSNGRPIPPDVPHAQTLEVPSYPGARPATPSTPSSRAHSPSYFPSSSSFYSDSGHNDGGSPRADHRGSPRSPSSVILGPDSPKIDLIRETLYAALGDVLATSPSLPRLLQRDPPRAYFASVALAILYVCQNRFTPDGSIMAVLDQVISEDDVPPEYKAFLGHLNRIGLRAKTMGEEDDERAMRCAQQGVASPEPRLDRLRRQLLQGAGSEARSEDGRGTPNGTVTALANRINAVALRMTQLKAFRERQNQVFKVLAGVKK